MEAALIDSPAQSVPGFKMRSDFSDARVHMVGIGGAGMAGLAAMLLRRGAHVSGSDRAGGAIVAELKNQGARIALEQTAAAIPPSAEWVVASAAIPADHPELLEAARRGLPVLKYAQMLGLLLGQHDGIAISGTHGKSTTTAWTAFVLRQAGFDPSFVVGADVDQLGGGSGVGGGPHFVAEACEYDRSFLNLKARCATILNIEEDHLDCYPNLESIREAFADFAALLPRDGLLVVNGHDEQCRLAAAASPAPVETFGFEPGCTWQATELAVVDGCHAFAISHAGRRLGHVRIGLSGRHNVLNALAVTALAHRCGVPWEALARGLSAFRGARRRLELRGEIGGVRIADDYAHHPTEIRVTLAAARERFAPQRLWCVFQPHQHSRTRFLLADFARSFRLAERVVVPDIYFVRDSQREREAVSAADLVQCIREQGGDARHIADFGQIVDHVLSEVRPGDLVLTMGAGDIWKAADELVRRLRGHLPG